MTTENNFYKDFPTLQSIAMELDHKIASIDKRAAEVKESERYADNEAERAYQLDKLEAEREQTLAELEEDFQVELEALEISLAEQAFSPLTANKADAEEADATATAIANQFTMTDNVTDMLALLDVRVKSMSDTEKEALARVLPTIEGRAQGVSGADEYLKSIRGNVMDTAHMRDVQEQTEQLRKIKAGGDSIRRKYDVLHKTVRGGRY